jgi:pimeloyl-ACP methyl ester carboxylesterase
VCDDDAVTTAHVNGIDVAYDTFGDPDQPTILLVMGLGAQMTAWDQEFCELLVDRGFHVVRFDNRDVGESTWIDDPSFDAQATILGLLSGTDVHVPYLLSDMAADAVGLLDHLGLGAVHLVGASMGGMIAQTIAIEHPERVRSLTSIMSTTGEPGVGAPDAEVGAALLVAQPTEREAAITHTIEVVRLISSPDHFDADRTRKRVEADVDRGVNPVGVARQLVAILASGSRADQLERLDLPALVVHGRQDRLVGFSGGQRTAALIAGADFLAIDDMAHDLPPAHWERIADAIATVAGRAA